MPAPEPIRPAPRAPIPIDARAADHLRYIRETMQSAGEFTAVPGWGGIAMGVTALVAAVFASRQHTPERWLSIWLVEAFVAVAIAMPAAATKAHRANAKLLSGPGRKFLLSFAPPILVGGLLTFALSRAGLHALLPGVWLLMTIRLALAYRYYLRMRHAVLAVAAGQVIVALVIATVLMFMKELMMTG